jgi:hypothetical protein
MELARVGSCGMTRKVSLVFCAVITYVVLTPGVMIAQAVLGCTGQQANKVACLDPFVENQAVGKTPGAPPRDPRSETGNAEIVTALTTSVPVPSPASGFTYSFDPASGAFVRSTETFGPILAERAETIGRNHFAFGIAYQTFHFDRIDGQNVNSLPTIFLFGGNVFAEATHDFDLSVNQVTLFADYGLTSRVDVSIGIPIAAVHYGLNFQGKVSGLPSGPVSLQASGTRDATGIGDVNLQLKGTLKRWEHASLAFATAFRLPSGDAYDALGAGALGIKPFLVYSLDYKRIAPHVNLGYEWNGSSILAGNVVIGTKRALPGQIPYAVGLDAGLSKSLTLDFDVLGQEMIHADRVLPPTTFQLPDGSQASSVGFGRQSYNITNGAVGLKVSAGGGRLLVIFNLLFRLNSGGIRATVAPLIGLSYTPGGRIIYSRF